MRVFQKFVRLTARDRVLLADAWLVLVAVRIALWFLPWRRAIALSGSLRISPPAGRPVDRLVWAVRKSSRLVPHTTCLPRALALHHLLTRAGYPSAIQIGVAKEPGGGLVAHAWVEHDGRVLFDRAGEVARYAPLLNVTASLG